MVTAAVHTAVVPLTATALQPANAVPASVKATLPLGVVALTVAVNVTVCPPLPGLAEVDSDVVLGDLLTLLTTCASVALADALLAASPA